jgi:hypothetical protein
VKAELGGHLRRKLSVFFVNLEDGINRAEMERRSKLADLHRSFIDPAQVRWTGTTDSPTSSTNSKEP